MHEGHIAGTLRFTSPPYEFSHLSPEMADLASQFKGYLETGRLVVGSKSRGPFVGEKLMFGAVRWLCANTDAQGFLFICKDRRRHYFENYGFHAVRENHSNPSIEILRPDEHELSLEEIRALPRDHSHRHLQHSVGSSGRLCPSNSLGNH